DALKLCFWEKATEPAGPHVRSLRAGQPVVFVVGPEGGLEEAEVEAAREAGFHIVSLGPLVLRTETVAAAVLGAVMLAAGERARAGARDGGEGAAKECRGRRSRLSRCHQGGDEPRPLGFRREGGEDGRCPRCIDDRSAPFRGSKSFSRTSMRVDLRPHAACRHVERG